MYRKWSEEELATLEEMAEMFTVKQIASGGDKRAKELAV
jgi:hypothetical protein